MVVSEVLFITPQIVIRSTTKNWCKGNYSDQQFENQKDVLWGPQNEKHISAWWWYSAENNRRKTGRLTETKTNMVQ